jgi:hypothetical protein
MKKYLILITITVLVAACARGGGEREDAVMKEWEDVAAAIAGRPGVTSAEARLGASDVIFVDVEVGREAIVAAGVTELDTGITPAMLAAAPHPVQFRITVPDLDGRYWWGEYDADLGRWTGMATHAKQPHPDLEPRLDEVTGTFVVALPAEG